MAPRPASGIGNARDTLEVTTVSEPFRPKPSPAPVRLRGSLGLESAAAGTVPNLVPPFGSVSLSPRPVSHPASP